ncbi:MAG: flagellar type III secretion system pore protein FliP [Nitrospirota bacterium]|uniref:Flagellar biosynthetic protein FliP n=1 Tax=Candidatus Magnetominusculus xianensis TaxID=1748249 RepID=A0ABR5SGB0_9BACT|nr:flagellar type III secretion system pore protein FliP [Candidatus Magnetominusculus xianensis]KWT84090.1 flagellar biosynthetic protein FliP [Candidatus Magnetominusculus xianensis]MBF0402383.1 flagellar type III secretion system pore protein FliP [Nitrospirota bacterium]
MGALNIDHPLISMFLLISFLSLIPAVLMMVTSFTRIVIVLSLLRQALGGPQIPPNMIIIGLSLFISLFIMYPTLDTVATESMTPFMNKKITMTEALKKAEIPVKDFMMRQTREKDLALFLKLAKQEAPREPMDIPMKIAAPAFVISELKTAFEMGFLLYLPFIIIDMVVASVMLSMGMMMVPPVMISLPFKLLLFVLVDGWNIVIGTIVRSFH